jgi:hypothetical protein
MYSEDFQNDPAEQEEEVEAAENLALEESEFEDDQSAYLINDEEISEEFQFQS